MNYEEIINVYDKTISKACYGYNGCKTPYEDRKQECLIAIFKCMNKFEKVKNMNAYIKRICINTNKNILRDEHLHGLHITGYKEFLDYCTEEAILIPYDPWVEEYRKRCIEYSKNYKKNVINANETKRQEWLKKNRKWQKTYKERNKELIRLQNKIYKYKTRHKDDLDFNTKLSEMEEQYKKMKIQKKKEKDEKKGIL